MTSPRYYTVIDANTQTMRCEVCGDEVPIPLGGLSWVVKVMKAFASEHRRCNGNSGRTTFSTPTKGGGK
jgi:hypothetical protein